MTRRERIKTTLRLHGRPLSAFEITRSCCMWFIPHAELFKMEEQGEIVGRWVPGPYPRRREYTLPEGGNK